MRAVRLHGYGDTAMLSLDEVSTPAAAGGEVLIRVAATAFHPSEIGLRRGLLRRVLPVEFPFVLGVDVSGIVVEVGAGVRGPVPGDRVIGRLDAGGAAAEYAVAPAAARVRPGGVLVSVTTPVRPSAGSQVRTAHFVARDEPDQLTALVRLVDAGVVEVDVSAVHRLADLALVHRAAEAGHTRGKIILIP